MTDTLSDKKALGIPDSMFAVPQCIKDDEAADDLIEIYWVFVARLQDEVKFLPLNTLQQMLLERVVTNYVLIRWRERKGLKSVDGYESAHAAKDANGTWLTTHKELNAQLKLTQDDFRTNYAALVAEAVADSMADFTPEMQPLIRKSLAKHFAAKGL
jgi:phosphoenolpyruvate carboxylase